MIGTLLLNAITQMLLSIAQNTGGELARKRIEGMLTQQALAGKVREAAQRVHQRFLHDLNNPELAQALDTPAFTDDPQVVTLLAQAATDTRHHHAVERELAHTMQRLAPHVAWPHCQHAAQLLVSLVHSEIGLLPELHQSIMILRGEQMLEEMRHLRPTPAYGPGVREGIEQAAITAAREMKQGYVTVGHLFYALLVQAQGMVRPLLTQMGITPDMVSVLLLEAISPYTGTVPDPMTSNAVHTLRRAQELARDSYAPVTRDDHVLLALLEQVGTSSSLSYLLMALRLDPAILHDLVRCQGQVVSVIQILATPQPQDQQAS